MHPIVGNSSICSLKPPVSRQKWILCPGRLWEFVLFRVAKEPSIKHHIIQRWNKYILVGNARIRVRTIILLLEELKSHHVHSATQYP